MDLLKMLSDLSEAITAMQAQIAAADEVAKAKYDEGFAAGVKSMQAPHSDKIYSQAELDAKVEEVVAPLIEQIEALKKDIEAAKAEVQPKIDEAILAFKAELLAKYNEQQVVESESETGFAELLK